MDFGNVRVADTVWQWNQSFRLSNPGGIELSLNCYNLLTGKERERVKNVLIKLASGKLQGLDIKKLQGRDDIFRVRKGDLRIVYRQKEGTIFILLIERRSQLKQETGSCWLVIAVTFTIFAVLNLSTSRLAPIP